MLIFRDTYLLSSGGGALFLAAILAFPLGLAFPFGTPFGLGTPFGAGCFGIGPADSLSDMVALF